MQGSNTKVLQRVLDLASLMLGIIQEIKDEPFILAQRLSWSKVKVGVLRPVQQPGSYWDRSSELPLVGLEPTEVTAYD